RRGPQAGRPLRRLQRTAPGDAAGVGGGHRLRRRRRAGARRSRLAAGALAATAVPARRPRPRGTARDSGCGTACGSGVFAAARKLAALFDGYSGQRPEMLRAWAEGTDSDGVGAPVPADLGWQPELWRRLRSRLDVPAPAERLGTAVAALRADPACSPLPE